MGKLERTKKPVTDEPEEETEHWQKIGGGSFFLGKNRIIKPNEKFYAKESEIPAGFRDVIIRLSGKAPATGKTAKAIPPKIVYTVSPVEDEEGLFNIVDALGKVMNETPLDEDSANELKKQLEA